MASCARCATTLSNDAKFCPACGRKAGVPKKRVRLLGVLAAGLVGVFILGTLSGPEAGKQKPAQPPLPVTARALADAYAANEAAAQTRYGDRPLLVSGTIAAIDLDLSNTPVVRLAGRNAFNTVSLNLTAEAQPKAAALKKGAMITATCDSVNEVIGSPILDGCRF